MRQTLSRPSYQLSGLSYVLRTENRPAWLKEKDGGPIVEGKRWRASTMEVGAGEAGRGGVRKGLERPPKFSAGAAGTKIYFGQLLVSAPTIRMTHIFTEQTFLLLTWSCAA